MSPSKLIPPRINPLPQSDDTRPAAGAGPIAYEGPVRRLRADGDPRLVIVADHASNAVPPAYGTLGLPPASFARHIAYDLGIAELAVLLSERLGAPALLAGFSRLLIDPNRGEDDPTLVMRLSDGEIIPGNATADEAEAARRVAEFHRPYHAAIDAALDAALATGAKVNLISVHSFTPAWRGRPRPWHCGILWGGDETTARYCMTYLRREKGLVVGDNEPYTGRLEGDCMDRHGTKRHIPHVLIEIRQDLLATGEGREAWAARLAPLLADLAAGKAG